jgi:hypothetical protein
VQIHFDTTDVVSLTVQTILSSHTANEVKLSDGERSQVAQLRYDYKGAKHSSWCTRGVGQIYAHVIYMVIEIETEN